MVELDQLIQTAKQVGAIHKKYFRNVEKRKKKVPNGVNPDICTVDEICDELILSTFGKKGLNINVVAEESGHQNNNSHETLYADGLDGTTFYLMGKKYSCVSLGLERNNKLIMGVVYNGLTDDLYFAEKGKGAYSIMNGVKKRLKSNNTKKISEVALAASTLKNLFKEETGAELLKKMVLDTWRFDCEGSIALNLCDIADGIFDIMLCPKVGGPWDYAAGIVILNEAGGYSGNWKGEKYDINNSSPIISSANKGLYDIFIKKYFGA